jgi:hypothetical protein
VQCRMAASRIAEGTERCQMVVAAETTSAASASSHGGCSCGCGLSSASSDLDVSAGQGDLLPCLLPSVLLSARAISLYLIRYTAQPSALLQPRALLNSPPSFRTVLWSDHANAWERPYSGSSLLSAIGCEPWCERPAHLYCAAACVRHAGLLVSEQTLDLTPRRRFHVRSTYLHEESPGWTFQLVKVLGSACRLEQSDHDVVTVFFLAGPSPAFRSSAAPDHALVALSHSSKHHESPISRVSWKISGFVEPASNTRSASCLGCP